MSEHCEHCEPENVSKHDFELKNTCFFLYSKYHFVIPTTYLFSFRDSTRLKF